MKWMGRFGCLLSLVVAGLAGGLLYATDMGRYLLLYLGALAGVTVGLAKQGADYGRVNAEVVAASIQDNQYIGASGTLTLRYPDGRGGKLRESFPIFSASARVATLKPGDTLAIDVCRHDPRIIKSYQFKVRDSAACAGAKAAGPSPTEPR